jgi:hypothetical protein
MRRPRERRRRVVSDRPGGTIETSALGLTCGFMSARQQFDLLFAICYLLFGLTGRAIRPEGPLAQSHRHENVQEWASDFDHPRTHFVYQIQIDLVL